MSSFIGRLAVLSKDGTPVAGVRTKGLTVNNTAVDITTDDDSGIRTLLATPGEKQVDITLSGITNDLIFTKEAISLTDAQDTYTLTYPPAADGSTTTGAEISGTFNFTSYSEGANYNEASTFDVTLNSSGTITFTDGTTV